MRGLALPMVIATAALGCMVSAPTASALYHSSASHTLYDGAGVTPQVFKTPVGTTTCNKSSLSGSMVGATSEGWTSVETFSECTLGSVFGSIQVNVSTAPCHTKWTKKFTFFHFTCGTSSGTQGLVISGPGCTIVFFEETLDGFDLIPVFRYARKAYRIWKRIRQWRGRTSGFVCGNTEFTNGEHTGEVLVGGRDTIGNAVDVWYTP